MKPEEIKQLTPDGYGGDFEPTAQEVQPDIDQFEQNLLKELEEV